ncbi:hypothetical protein OG864_00640 [Streptomyces sp. NBC_00124]|uniref:hypothetical protein n=1 Tax=Streptomyces sp. NBC_00124 TaxID=2975662 RepID=UPI00224FA269|nr:hypothetical protein [Streptomyces sp. NBC_00124]MCX5357290.1 hypothetical protein [Streptomyces sp. NBC_00124]
MSVASVSGSAALVSALAEVPGRVVWVCLAVTVLATLPALVPEASKARTAAMWRRHEDRFLADPPAHREGLDHIARVRQQAAGTPIPGPVSEGPAPSDGAEAGPSP